MSAIAKTTGLISPEEYLEGERLSEIRREYVDGYVYAMAGASDDHNRIALNLATELQTALRGKRCEAFTNDMKLRMPPAIPEAFYYPDVLVACEETDNARYFREQPSILFEVLSPETERIDRREKANAHRQIPSVKVYVLLEQDRIAVTVLRNAEAGWTTESIEGKDARLRLPEISVEISLERIYERTRTAKASAA